MADVVWLLQLNIYKTFSMKKIILALGLIVTAGAARATVNTVNVADSTVRTVSGVGGYAEVVYKFAKGDKVTLTANASKELERIMIVLLPQNVLLRIKNTKKATQTFDVPENGNVVIRFVSDRGGVNDIHYKIARLPASDDLQNFDTKADPASSTIKLHP